MEGGTHRGIYRVWGGVLCKGDTTNLVQRSYTTIHYEVLFLVAVTEAWLLLLIM